jgi:hypothetical protein
MIPLAQPILAEMASDLELEIPTKEINQIKTG